MSAEDGDDILRSALLSLEGRAHSLLSQQLWLCGNFDEAETELDFALAAAPSGALEIRHAIMLPIVPDSVQQIDAMRLRMATRLLTLLDRELHVDEPVTDIDWTCFLLAYHGEHNNIALQRLFHQVCSKACPDLDWVAPHIGGKRAPGRLRVGFVSSYFNDHTISRLFIGLIQQLDAQAFDVQIFALADNDRFLRNTALPGKTIVTLPGERQAARQVIAASHLDILIYLDLGMDPFTLFLAHARLAPIQAMLWGHPDTSGLDQIDFVFSSDAMEPDDGESHYSEQLVRLPGIATWVKRPVLPTQRRSTRDFGLPDGDPIFLCPQTPQKFHPDFDSIIRQIMRRLPKALMILTAGWSPEPMARVRERILRDAPELAPRLIIVGAMERDHFVGLMQVADVLLDPPHYSGGHTSLEAFACGAPVVTWPGRHMRARHTFGCYRIMGMRDCVARDLKDYIEIAVALGTDKARQAGLRQAIRSASASLFEDDMAVRAFEAFLASIPI